MKTLEIEIKATKDLASQIYQDALMIRKEVFVKEQGVDMALELDGELGPTHYVLYYKGKPAATARTSFEQAGWHIQRVATLKSYRKLGLAKRLLSKIEEDARQSKVAYLTLGAQDSAQGFYTKLGYQVVGAGFLDAGITHHRMDKSLQIKEN